MKIFTEKKFEKILAEHEGKVRYAIYERDRMDKIEMAIYELKDRVRLLEGGVNDTCSNE